MALLPFDDRDGTIWFDGQLIPWRDAKLHVLSHGLHYASAVFEGERVYEGRIFKSAEHAARLVRSAELMDFTIPYSAEDIDRFKVETVKANGIVDGYVRPIAWRGSEMMGVSAQHNKIHLAIATWVWPSYFDPELRSKGIRLAISDWRRPAPNMAPVASKAAGLYMICTLSKHKAEREGYQDALMLDHRGLVAEATGANIFFVMKGELHTPTPDCFLDGITRRTVIDLARQRGIKVVERAIQPEEMAEAEQCFLCGTAAEVTPVGEIGPYKFTVGDITRTLMEDYATLVRTPAQAQAAE
ncbi:MAG: branched-chain amino acid aminotransferase [Alphaproteobacteria bacterium]|nr:branched-chain amino acid aminotransferase [Alphaproteobacteria bacterium]MBU0796510.1 branched-chain amino acid aminotransferase [Alphaproteobacteria bacterium]MBU0888076.1 branched-chain amino acid aminotransferase [Alphaproteobacteria bacterium]MBU1811521.1 branched-chain amino acid aminotransferase [Alphaproteobacteria bacterium]MBU2090334.1 branched-chain amino acid aminotransferase [Alphaproteobacteria bacterium]